MPFVVRLHEGEDWILLHIFSSSSPITPISFRFNYDMFHTSLRRNILLHLIKGDTTPVLEHRVMNL